MIRSVLAVLALVVLSGFTFPPPAEAQQEARSHEVREGETLWRIAQQHYGDGGLWNRIFDANRDRLDDPGVLEVGLVLTIPPVDGPTPRAEEPVGEQPVGEQPTPEVGVVEVRAPDTGAAPQEIPREGFGAKPIDRRTAFYPDTTNPTLRNEMAPMLSAVSRDAVYSAPWLVGPDEEISRLGEVVNFAGSEGHVTIRSSAHPHDELLIAFNDYVPAVGSLVHVYREHRDVMELGKVVKPTGVVRIVALQPAGAVGEVVKLYDRLRLGDLVGFVPEYQVVEGRTAAAATEVAESEIIGFANSRPIYSIGDITFLDATSGVNIGDEYVVIYQAGEGWSGNAEGRLQVVRVGDDHVTARILAEERPVFTTGARVRLDRRMR